MDHIKGLVIYQGPSRIDGSPIVGILTPHSENRGTGDMAQFWILRADVDPVQAVKTGEDVGICGNCPLRGLDGKGRSCYVFPLHGPHPVYHAYRNGAYGSATDGSIRQMLRGRTVRLGAYGDPCAVPIRYVRQLVQASNGHTGYTHQWGEYRNHQYVNRDYRQYVMASVETPALADHAHKLGWRTFRVRRSTDEVRPDEIVCPKSDEGGSRLQCLTCKACNGSPRKGKRNVVIVAHGGIASKANAVRYLASVDTWQRRIFWSIQ